MLPIEDEILVVSNDRSADLVALDDVLNELAKIDPEKAKLVELRYFDGLNRGDGRGFGRQRADREQALEVCQNMALFGADEEWITNNE